MTSARIMADGPLPADVRQSIQRHGELVAWHHPEQPDPSIVALFTYGHPQVDASLLAQLPNVRGVSNHGVGLDHVDIQACRRRGIEVRNTPGVLDGAVADAAMMLLLAAARRLLPSVAIAADPRTVQFDQSANHGQEVHNAVLGIVGFGRIGQEIARRATGFNMRILYHQRHRDEAAEQRWQATYCQQLHALLAAADFVVLVVPLTAETHHLMAAKEFETMKETAVLVNIARGPVVQTQDLVEALQRRTIWAAALDVTDPEPLPRDHPLLTLENCFVTAHLGSATIQTRKKMVDMALDNLAQLLGFND